MIYFAPIIKIFPIGLALFLFNSRIAKNLEIYLSIGDNKIPVHIDELTTIYLLYICDPIIQ